MSAKKSRVDEGIREYPTYPNACFRRWDECEVEEYGDGYAVTKYGVVAVYMQKGKDKHTRLWFVHNGRTYARTIARTYELRGLLIVAGKFARDIVENMGEMSRLVALNERVRDVLTALRAKSVEIEKSVCKYSGSYSDARTLGSSDGIGYAAEMLARALAGEKTK